jgi:signal transduction histidine kinase/CheY-like chemotaxis protein/transcriptional regulator with GAF, ATPase, and Fis domain
VARTPALGIRGKLFAIGALIIVPVTGLGFLVYGALSGQVAASQEVRRTADIISLARKADEYLVELQTVVGGYVLFGDRGMVAGVDEAYTAFRADVAALQRLVRDPELARRLETLRVGVADWYAGLATDVVAAVDRGDRREALRLARESRVRMQELRREADQFVEGEEHLLHRRTVVHRGAQRRTFVVVIGGGIAVIAFSVGAALVLGGRITRPLLALTRAAESFAAGEGTQPVPVETRDEIGALATAFNTMTTQVARREEALDRARREAQILLGIAGAIGGTLDLQEALRLICRELSRLTGAETVSVHVLDRATNALRPMAGYHVPKEMLDVLATTPLPLLEQGFAPALAAGRPLWSDEIQQDPWFAFPLFRRFPHQSGLVLPLVLDGAVSGAFYLVWWRERRRFEEGELGTLRVVGQQVGVLLQNARLFEETERRRRAAEALADLGRTLAGTLDPAEMGRQIVSTACRLLGASASALFEIQTASGELVRLAAEGEWARVFGPGLVVPIGTGMTGLAVRLRAPVVTPDTLVDPRVTYPSELRDRLERVPERAILAVPLVVQDRVIGAFAVGDRVGREFGPDEIALARAFADQAAVALEKARLFGDVQDRHRLSTGLYTVANAMAQTMELGPRLDAFVKGAGEALGFDRINILLLTADGTELELAAGSQPVDEGRRRIPLWRGAGAFEAVLESGRALTVTSDEELARIPVVAPELRDHPVLRARRFAVVPLKAQGRAIGLVSADNKPSRRPIPSLAVAQLELFCQQLAVAVANALLHAETRQSLAAATLLNEAARTLHGTLDVRRRLPDALASLGGTFGAVGAAVAIDRAGEAAADVVHWGAWSDLAARALAPMLVARQEPLVLGEGAASLDFLPPELRRLGVIGLGAFPVLGRSRRLGWLLLVFATPRAISELEARLLAAYADQLAMALENATLFEDAANQRTTLEQIFSSTSDGILVVDLDGRVTALNRQGGSLLGVVPTEVIGRPFHQLVDRLGEAVAWDQPGPTLLHAVVTGGMRSAAGDIEVRGPEPRILRWQARPTHDAMGTAVGLTITLQDVTREREVSRLKTEFVSTVSHELRTPLTSIKGSLHLLLTDPDTKLDDTQLQLLDISLKNTDRLIRLINDILDVSRIEAGRIQLQRRRHRVSEFVGLAVDGIRSFADSRRVVLERDLADGLPELHVDLDRMVQVFTNLLSNAIKFSPEGGRILVTALRRGAAEGPGTVEVAVRDQGRGIAAEDMPKLFEKFRQLDSTTIREVGGTGLGLAICRGLVEEHGGRIWVESAPGAGATFVVSLPVAPASRPATPVTGGPTILVVDDEPEVRSVLRSHLERSGYRVLEAGLALEAIEVAQARRPDLITMDVLLPDLDGLETVRLLRQHADTRAIPVVVLTGGGGREDDAAEIPSLVKPVDEATLLQVVRAALAGRPVPRSPTVLVADASSEARAGLARALAGAGFGVVTVADGDAALARVAEQPPDLVLLDIEIAGKSSYEILVALRREKTTRDVPVVMLTPSDRGSGRDRAIALGATAYVRKPFLAAELVETVRASLEARGRG